MTHPFKVLTTIFFCCLWILSLSSTANAADLVTGQAIIENGDLTKAAENARRDAMRTYVEDKIGVHVESTTEVANNMVVRDNILAHSDGYVQVKRIIKEWQNGDIYFIQMELEADNQKIKTAPQDLKASLQAMDENSSRSGIQVAITGKDRNGQNKDLGPLNQYFQGKLENIGFTVTSCDEVTEYMVQHIHEDPLSVGIEARRIFRSSADRGASNALIRGTLSTLNVSKESADCYAAVVNASFELVGLDSNDVNTFSENITAAAPTAYKAEARATELAIQKAAETLGKRALETVQSEYRGGSKHIKITLRFAGISDRIEQKQAILTGLKNCNCRIIRSAFANDGQLRIFIETAEYSTLGDLQEAILSNITGLQDANENQAELGSTKLNFTF